MNIDDMGKWIDARRAAQKACEDAANRLQDATRPLMATDAALAASIEAKATELRALAHQADDIKELPALTPQA